MLISKSENSPDISFSIIIPHYNSPELLVRCVSSIPNRDDIEIIVVDDNSPESGAYLERYSALRRSGLQWIPTYEGRGAGYSRNVGLEHAKGKWVIFADADDFFTYCFGDILDEYLDSQADMICFNACSVDCKTYLNNDRSDWVRIPISWAKKDFEKTITWFRYQFGAPWCRIIRRSLIEETQIRFEEVSIHNDTRFAYNIGHMAQKVEIEPKAGYCLTMRNDSITYSNFSAEKMLISVRIGAQKQQFFFDHNIPIWSSLTYYAMSRIKESGNRDIEKQAIEIIRNVLKDSKRVSFLLHQPKEYSVHTVGDWEPFSRSFLGQNAKRAYLENNFQYRVLLNVLRLFHIKEIIATKVQKFFH